MVLAVADGKISAWNISKKGNKIAKTNKFFEIFITITAIRSLILVFNTAYPSIKTPKKKNHPADEKPENIFEKLSTFKKYMIIKEINPAIL
jgi:hypothetical protein